MYRFFILSIPIFFILQGCEEPVSKKVVEKKWPMEHGLYVSDYHNCRLNQNELDRKFVSTPKQKKSKSTYFFIEEGKFRTVGNIQCDLTKMLMLYNKNGGIMGVGNGKPVKFEMKPYYVAQVSCGHKTTNKRFDNIVHLGNVSKDAFGKRDKRFYLCKR